MPMELKNKKDIGFVSTIFGELLFHISILEMHTAGMDFEAYAESILVQDAVSMRLRTIGELFKRLTPLGRDDPYDMEKIFPADMLRGVKSMRDFMAHHYAESEISYAWDTIKNEIPKMKKIISSNFIKRNRMFCMYNYKIRTFAFHEPDQ